MTNATERKNVEKMSPEDRARFEDERQELESQLKAIREGETSTAKDAINEGVVRRNLQKTSDMLEKDEELVARGRQKDALAREAKQLEAELRENMPTKNEMWPPRMGTSEAEAAVRKEMRFQSQYSDKARRWQDIQRRLEPDNPYAGSLDRIRPER